MVCSGQVLYEVLVVGREYDFLLALLLSRSPYGLSGMLEPLDVAFCLVLLQRDHVTCIDQGCCSSIHKHMRLCFNMFR